jgi:ankyrin repeat protein
MTSLHQAANDTAHNDDDASFCSEDSFFADGMGYDKIGPATDLNRELLSAAHDGQLSRLQDLIRRGADINYNTWDVLNLFTPLCLAVEFDHVDMVEWLATQPGIDMQKPCCAGTPLNLASGKSKKNSKSIVEILLANGARDDTAIVAAQDMKTIERLLQHGTDINTPDKKGNTLLHSLCSSYRDDEKYVAFIKKVIELGADVNAKNHDGETPLHQAYMHENICQVLLEQGGANLEAKDNRGETVFYKCFRSSVTEFLIGKGANVNVANKDGDTRIHKLCNQAESSPGSHIRELTLLVGAGADLNARGYRGRTALGVGIENGKTSVVARLVQEGADPCLGDDKGWNALHMACHKGRSKFLEMLFDAGVSVNEPTKTGWTALHLAVSSIWNRGSEDVVQKLLEHGADPNTKNPVSGATPLAGAMSMFGNLTQVKLLIKYGADLNAVTKWPDSDKKRTVDSDSDEDYSDDGMDEDGRGIQKKPKKVRETPLVEETPLHWAIYHQYEDVALHLLENGADMVALNSRGETPLLLASKLGLRFVVARLLEMGVEVELEQGGQVTPLSEACKGGHLDVINLLTHYQFT